MNPDDGGRAYVGLGSNLDDPVHQIERAVGLLAKRPGIRSVRLSRMFRSAPWGPIAQPDFVNAVVEIDGSIAARPLLETLLEIEIAMGRERRERWGPRRIDLDLLWHEAGPVEADGISVPHPRLHERAFVLKPWSELAPDCVVPGQGRVADLLARVDCSGLVPLT